MNATFKSMLSMKILILSTIFFTMIFSHRAFTITVEEQQILKNIRNNIFGGSRLSAAFEQATISGEAPPIFPYEVEDRGLIVWTIKADEIDNFTGHIELPHGFTLAKSKSLTVQGSQVDSSNIFDFFNQQDWNSLDQLFFPENYYVIADIGNTSRLEQGAKVEFKTFVNIPGDPIPRLYRFASFKSVPGVDLLQLSNNNPVQLSVSEENQVWQGNLNSELGSLSWWVPLKTKRNGKVKTQKKTRFSEAFLNAGQSVYGPMGVSARYFYDGSSVSGKFYATEKNKVQLENSFSWAQYLNADFDTYVLETKSEFLVQPNTMPIKDITGGIGDCSATFSSKTSSVLFSNLVGCVLQQKPPQEVFGDLFAMARVIPQTDLPSLYFAILDLYQGLQIYAGAERPKLTFALFDDPKTIFINFEIPKHKAKAFAKAYLPSHFQLAKIKFYKEQKNAVYAVSLNVYKASGQNLNGFRAEWSTYVINPNEEEPKPRFSVLEAQTDIGGFDPVVALERYFPGLDLTDPQQLGALIEPPSDKFSYVVDESDAININVEDHEENITLDVNIKYPNESRILYTEPTTDWMEANDFVYWGEVADILKYDNQVMFAELLVFEAQDSDLILDTTFTEYVNPKPLPIIFWKGGQNIALEPWGNLDSIPIK